MRAKETAGSPAQTSEGVISPAELKRLIEERETAKAQEALQIEKRLEAERDEVRRSFLDRQIHPDVAKRLSGLMRQAAERGETEVMLFKFPSDLCEDGGRAINNNYPDWPDSLTGFARRAYEYWQQHLRPQGYRLRVQVLDYPGGMPGNIGVFLNW